MTKCVECRFWAGKIDERSIGECRKDPPRVVFSGKRVGLLTVWPETFPDGCCGVGETEGAFKERST